MNREEIEKELWEYIDGTCNEADMQRISILIATDSVWMQEYNELAILHASVPKDLELDQPSMRFTKNVMDKVAAEHLAPATKKYINKGIIRGIAAVFVIMISIALGYAFATANLNADNSGSLLKIGKTNIGNIFNGPAVNWIIYANIVLILLFADTLLRRKRGHN